MTKMVGEGGLRRNASLAEQSRGQNGWSAIQSNVLGYPIDKDTHYGITGQKEAMKYLKKNCYHRIKCSVANSLAALMWK